jgi:hypothetical protein
MKNIKLAPEESFPLGWDDYLPISNLGYDVIHLTRLYPDEHLSLCGRANRSSSYDRTFNDEFARTLCGDCAAIVKKETQT